MFVDTNARIHERIDHAYVDFLEWLIQCDLSRATASFESAKELLMEHMKAEEGTLCPAFAEIHGEEHARLLKQIDGDHTILLRSLTKVERCLGDLKAQFEPAEKEEDGPHVALRRAIVLEMDTWVRVRNVLEHHTVREQRDFYPHFEGLPNSQRKRELLDALQVSLRHED